MDYPYRPYGSASSRTLTQTARNDSYGGKHQPVTSPYPDQSGIYAPQTFSLTLLNNPSSHARPGLPYDPARQGMAFHDPSRRGSLYRSGYDQGESSRGPPGVSNSAQLSNHYLQGSLNPGPGPSGSQIAQRNPHGSRFYPVGHQDRSNRRQVDIDTRRDTARHGICHRCGLRPPVGGITTCQSCRDKRMSRVHRKGSRPKKKGVDSSITKVARGMSDPEKAHVVTHEGSSCSEHSQLLVGDLKMADFDMISNEGHESGQDKGKGKERETVNEFPTPPQPNQNRPRPQMPYRWRTPVATNDYTDHPECMRILPSPLSGPICGSCEWRPRDQASGAMMPPAKRYCIVRVRGIGPPAIMCKDYDEKEDSLKYFEINALKAHQRMRDQRGRRERDSYKTNLCSKCLREWTAGYRLAKLVQR
ncbi:hypothetical protein NOF04DRAFT_1272544 [Fusarium oxysporum II5]|nr:hypothetical protein NOF04DRAFT_1272544 [Fusarium oxysporum II5]